MRHVRLVIFVRFVRHVRLVIFVRFVRHVRCVTFVQLVRYVTCEILNLVQLVLATGATELGSTKDIERLCNITTGRKQFYLNKKDFTLVVWHCNSASCRQISGVSIFNK